MGSDLPYYLAFARVRGIGAARVRRMLQYFPNLADAWMASRADLAAAGLDDRSVQAIAEAKPEISPEREVEALHKSGARAVTWMDADYPRRLREIDLPPPVLWVHGAFTDGDALAVAIVGTRQPSMYGRDVAAHFARGLAERGVCVVSGLARGVDGVAHQTALEAGGRTLAVLGSGVDTVYPAEHRQLAHKVAEHGAVISDYPLGTQPDAVNFPPRNRIISGLSLGVIVVECDEKSGALITTRFAADQGRDVFAVPGNIFAKTSRGPNMLLQDGARPALDVDRVLDELQIERAAHQADAAHVLPEPLNDIERSIIDQLGHEPMPTDELIRALDLPAEDVTSALAFMELKGMVRHAGASGYVLGRA